MDTEKPSEEDRTKTILYSRTFRSLSLSLFFFVFFYEKKKNVFCDNLALSFSVGRLGFAAALHWFGEDHPIRFIYAFATLVTWVYLLLRHEVFHVAEVRLAARRGWDTLRLKRTEIARARSQ